MAIFYENGEEYKKVVMGSPIPNMHYMMRVSKDNESYAHTLFGGFRLVNDQLFTEYIPEIGPGSHLQIRQDVPEGNIVDVKITRVIDGKTVFFNPAGSIHNQPANNQPIYVTKFYCEPWNVVLVIGSGVSEDDLTKAYFDAVWGK